MKPFPYIRGNGKMKPIQAKFDAERRIRHLPRPNADNGTDETKIVGMAKITHGPENLIDRDVHVIVDLIQFAKHLPAVSAVHLYRQLVAMKVDRMASAVEPVTERKGE